MPPVKRAFVPRFMFSPSSSQRIEPGQDQARSQIDKSGKKKRRKNAAEKTTPLLKVQLVERNSALVTNKKKNKTKWTLEAASRKKTKINQERQTQSVNPALVRDVFFFSETSNSQTLNEKEKDRHSVLRTISKMLQENHLIRNRLAALSQAK